MGNKLERTFWDTLKSNDKIQNGKICKRYLQLAQIVKKLNRFIYLAFCDFT